MLVAEQSDVGLDGLPDFADADVFVGRVGACGVAGAELEGREGHERLVAEGRRPEGLHAHVYALADEGMANVDVRGAEPEGARLHLAAGVLADDVIDLLVRVEFVGAHVYHHVTLIGYYVVLCAGIDDRHLHLRGTEEVADALEPVAAEPAKVVEDFVDGVDALVAGGMSRLAVSRHVEHHESFLCYGGLHARRFAHDGNVYRRQFRQCLYDAVGSRHLFFGGSEEDKVKGGG